MKNPTTGETRDIKIGFSWTLLLFSGFFGIPLFMRKLSEEGGAMLVFAAFQIPAVIFDSEKANMAANLTGIGIILYAIFLGFKGNQITVKNLLKLGWVFENEQGDVERFIKMKWSLT